MLFPESGRAHAVLPAEALGEVDRIVEAACVGGLLNAFVGSQKQVPGIFQALGQQEIRRSVREILPPVAIKGACADGVFPADIFQGYTFSEMQVHIGDDFIDFRFFEPGRVVQTLFQHDFTDQLKKEQNIRSAAPGTNMDSMLAMISSISDCIFVLRWK